MKYLNTWLIVSAVLTGCSSGSTDNAEGAGVSLFDNEPDSPNASDGSVSSNTTQTPNSVTPSEPAETMATGQDPLIQNNTEVTFDITVPAYKSNELRIDLVWSETTTTANWVGDEYWSATMELPTGERNNLRVTFYDENGGIELAVFEREFTTGFNAAQTVKIEADQFEIESFDTDGDGTSNLDELIVGKDPRIDENTLLNVTDSVQITYLISTSQLLEQEIPDERPYNFGDSTFVPFTDEDDSQGTSYTTVIDIDVNGNGTYSYSSYANYFKESRKGTRTNSGSAISWEGRLTTYDGDYGRGADFTSSVSVIDHDTFEISEELSEVYSGTYRDTWDVKSKLIGKRIENTSHCNVVAGQVTYTRWTNRIGPIFTPTTTITKVTKAVGDQYWKVDSTNSDNEITEYLARELKVAGGGFAANDRVQESAPTTFKCDFVDVIDNNLR